MSGSEIKNDYMVRAVAADGSIQRLCGDFQRSVEEGRKRHKQQPGGNSGSWKTHERRCDDGSYDEGGG